MRPLVYPTQTNLAGIWQYRADPNGLGEHYAEQLAYTHADDARWMEAAQPDTEWNDVVVPGPWPLVGNGQGHTLWVRRRFEATVHDGRAVLVFEGVNYFSDFWLNGHYLGSHEGYLGRIRLDVTGLLAADNFLVVKIVPPHDVLGQEDQMNQLKHHFVGALGRWDMNDPENKPAGIWGDVRLDQHGTVGIERTALTYRIAQLPPPLQRDEPVPVETALSLRIASALGAASQSVTVKWSISPKGFDGPTASGESAAFLVAGMRDFSMDLSLDTRLWWTWDLGDARLYEISVELIVDRTVADRRTWLTGFRTLALGDGWDLKLNGISLYQRGANYLSDLDLSSMTNARYRDDVALFRAANLNTVHPFCLVEGDGLYEACDEAGLIVYQDFPLWLMAETSSDLVRRALVQFDDMLERLGASPSVAIWNFGSQPSVANVDKLCTALVRHARAVDPSRIAHLGNGAVAYEEHDDVHPTRSFFWSEENARRFEAKYDWRRDSHMYPGWYFDGVEAIRNLPRHHFGLVTEFGAQALPNAKNLSQFMALEGPIDWRTLARHCGQPGLLQRHNPNAQTVLELIEASQRYQAELLRHHTEFIRSLKGRPGRGLHVFAFNDCWPSVTWSMLDYDRAPKPSYVAVSQAMAPVQSFLMSYRDGLRIGQNDLPFCVVNDHAEALTDVLLRVEAKVAGMQIGIAHLLIATLGTDSALDVSLLLDVAHAAEDVQLTAELLDGEGRLISTNSYVLGCR